MPFSVRMPIIALLSLSLLSLLGCGEKTVMVTPASRAESVVICLGCHQQSSSPVTGKVIYEEWKLSSHNLKNAASCADCHEPEAGHPTSCNLCHGGTSSSISNSVTHNPDLAGKCAKCHTANAGFKRSLRAHFNNNTSVGYPASYVSSVYNGNCRKCHNPHDTNSKMDTLRSWASSGHGKTDAPPWKEYDFKSRTGECNRCHTTTGFIKYVTTGNSDPWGTASDKTKEVLACNACHTDYSFVLRPVNQVVAKYTGGEVTYPNIGASNLCLNCHVGRESGNTIKNVQRNYTSAGFVNSHYLTAGGIIFGEIGYEYDNRDYSDPAGPSEIYRHRYIGTSDPRGNSAAASNSGPCVGCHLANKTQPGEKHTFKPYILTGTALSPTCETSGCHGVTLTRLTPRDKTWLQTVQQPRYQAALSALKYYLANNQYRKLFFAPNNPYFFRDEDGDGLLSPSEINRNNPQKKWHSVSVPVADTVVTGKNNMGAAFNFNLMFHDKGGVAHNRFYTRRLIYDSIDWLDDNLMNYSVWKTLDPLPGTGDTVFKADAIAYLINAGTNNVNIGTSAERF